MHIDRGKIMSLFGSLFNRKKLNREPEKDNSVEEIFEREEEEEAEDASLDDEMLAEEEAEQVYEEEEDPNMEYEVVEREILPAKIICPDCAGITLEGLDFCDKCGGELN